MSCNSHKPHVLVLAEDEPYRKLAAGFVDHHDIKSVIRAEVCGGWTSVFDQARQEIRQMHKFKERILVLLMDFDRNYEARKQRLDEIVPPDLKDRVFLLGANVESEDLKRNFQSSSHFNVGKKIADACVRSPVVLSETPQLTNSIQEMRRLRSKVENFLFV
jgi:hypothetical protein